MFFQMTIKENHLHVNLRLVIPFVNKTGLKLLVRKPPFTNVAWALFGPQRGTWIEVVGCLF